MNRGLDEVVADLLHKVDQLEDRNSNHKTRIDLSIKRLVKIEKRLEDIVTRLEALENNKEDKN